MILAFLANSDDPDEMQHNAAFHQGLHCLLRLKHPLGTKYIEISKLTCDPFKYRKDKSMLIVSICTKKSIRMNRVHILRSKYKPLSKDKNLLLF